MAEKPSTTRPRSDTTESMLVNKKRDSEFIEKKNRYSAQEADNEISYMEEKYDLLVRYLRELREDYDKLKSLDAWKLYPQLEERLQKSIAAGPPKAGGKTPDEYRNEYFNEVFFKNPDATKYWNRIGAGLFKLWRDFEKMLDVAFRAYETVTSFQKNTGGKYSHNYHESRVDAIMNQNNIGKHFNQFCTTVFSDMKDGRNKSKDQWENNAPNMPTNYQLVKKIMEAQHGGTMVLDTDFKEGLGKLKAAVTAEIKKKTDAETGAQGGEKKQKV